MISEGTNYFEIEEKFLVVLDSAIPSQIGGLTGEVDFLQTGINNSYTKKSNLIFDLQYPIEKTQEDIQLKCAIKSAVFPNSQYIINSTNSYFAIGLIDDTNTPVVGGNLVCEIPQGNYDVETLRQKLQTVITNAFNDAGFFDIYWNITYDTTTYKYVFNLDIGGTSVREFFISFQPQDLGTRTSVSQFGSVIGFLNDYRYYSGYIISALKDNAIFSYTSRSITANYPSNLSGLRSINVILQNYSISSIPIRPYNSQFGFKNSIINSSFNNSQYQQFLRQNVICNISCNANPMEYIFYEKQSDFFIDLKESVLNRFHILLTDNYGNLLELNNQDWTLTLEISLLKKKDFKTKSFYEYLSNP
jgi:hypothetical protein